MILPDKKDAIHKAWLYRLLEGIADDRGLSSVLYFKGGSCASMLGWLPRFSVDLDFDYAGTTVPDRIRAVRARLEKLFNELGLVISDQSKNGIQYFLKYAHPNTYARRSLKIEASFPLFTSSVYEPARFIEIDRILHCQTRETMFAHKLVAPLDRFEKTGQIAGRDIFDIHHFFMSGVPYRLEVIEERRGISAPHFLGELRDFIKRLVTEKVITEDLSFLLPLPDFKRIRTILKREVLTLIQDEIQRLQK